MPSSGTAKAAAHRQPDRIKAIDPFGENLQGQGTLNWCRAVKDGPMRSRRVFAPRHQGIGQLRDYVFGSQAVKGMAKPSPTIRSTVAEGAISKVGSCVHLPSCVVETDAEAAGQ